MAVGLPTKVSYANGDVFSASDINDTNGTINAYVSTGKAAGVNKIINGDLRFNQRNFTSISGSADTYGFDRFKLVSSGGGTWTPQTFTAGTAPVAGYEGVNYSRIVTSGQTGTTPYTVLNTTIEDVRILSGQTATISFWAKSASGTPKIALEVIQGFGSGGSPSSSVLTYVAQSTISTTWTRYSITTTIPSISGKTIGTTANTSSTAFQFWVSAGTDFNARTGSLGIQSNTFDMWGFQVEAGSTATIFQTATATIQGELAACQRYYYRQGGDVASLTFGVGPGNGGNIATISIKFAVPMRVAPGTVDYSTLTYDDGVTAFTCLGTSGYAFSSKDMGSFYARSTATNVSGRMYQLSGTSTSSYIGWSAEL